MSVDLYNTLTVIAVIWIIVLCLLTIGGDELGAILGILFTLCSIGLILYRLGEFVKFLIG